jgi:phage shock protein A
MTRRNENPELSEWDMEMPRNNKFHDPLAAPLEPTPEKFEKANEEAWSLNRYDFAEAYAAAVSKNLQQQHDELFVQVNELDDDLDVAKSHIAELEKEITALRSRPTDR